MIYELIVVAPFVALLYPQKIRIGQIALAIAAFAVEFFSPLPFGAAFLALLAAYMITTFFLRIFDASSLVSLCFTFLLGFLFHALFFTVMHMFTFNVFEWQMVGRGVMMFLREVFIGSILIMTCISLEYIIQLFRYAIVEEKIR